MVRQVELTSAHDDNTYKEERTNLYGYSELNNLGNEPDNTELSKSIRRLEIKCTSEFLLNEEYSDCHLWTYALLQASVGFCFGYALTCINNLSDPIIESGLGLTGNAALDILAEQNLYFGLGKVLMSIFTGSLADRCGRKN